MKELALKKLEQEKAKVTGQKERVMAEAVYQALSEFCGQEPEFAQAVYQGGSFVDCMKQVAKGVGGHISDLDAYRKAVQFYFPGADIRCNMTVRLCQAQEEGDHAERQPGVVLDLFSLL